MGQKLITVRGLVIPVEWDKWGRPTGTAIFGNDEQQYIVEQDEVGNELLEQLQEDLELEGVIRKTRFGEKVISVKSYRSALESGL